MNAGNDLCADVQRHGITMNDDDLDLSGQIASPGHNNLTYIL